jgi:hypothetical protein
VYSLDVTIGGPLHVRDALIGILLEAQYQMDLVELRDDPSIPALLTSGVRYWSPACTRLSCPDAPWEGPTAILERGTADCKSLAAWRRAELYLRHGIETFFVVPRQILDTGDVEYHVTLSGWHGGRKISEDVSALLGM